jgi:hypothetical protein
MVFQITAEGEQMGLVQVTKNHTKVLTNRYSEIISTSLQLFKENGEEDGFDSNDLSDFVTYNNLHSVLEIERIFIKEEIEY